MGTTEHDTWMLAGREMTSRIILGTARYPSQETLLESLKASGTELVTVALRRVNVGSADGTDPTNLYTLLTERGYALLPNTAGCFTAADAILTARARPRGAGRVADQAGSAQELVRRGFQVLPYTNDDPVTARKLEDVGCSAVMPLGAPIGSGLGIRNPHNIQLIKERANVPVIVDAGVGTASDVAIAFELGCDGVLMNTAVARSRNPVQMARAMNAAARAGRDAFLAGRMPRKFYADASSPSEGMISPLETS
ncbi:Thiazole synthase [Geodia barretti]|uniref:thiazole synthase n=1 Tax=Geodia barretti TaxID=519541 RepID=A0AA35RIY6_GEOBA|nr:Thiazole synthase [Geodia barretti]